MSKPINSVQDVLDTPIAQLTDAQFSAFLDGRESVRQGYEDCYCLFHDTQLCWRAGREWELKRQAS